MLLGLPLHPVTLTQAVDHIAQAAAAGAGGWVITPNLDILRRLRVDGAFRTLCEGVTLRLADGMPLVWASKLRRTPLPERAAGSDLIYLLCDRAARVGLPVFFLGGNPGAGEDAARVLGEKYAGFKVAGIACPPMGFESDHAYMQTLRAQLVESRAAIVLVALGSPKQERLIATLRRDLPSAWFLGIGVTFSFVSGEIRRAPMWMRRTGLEWVHRLLQEPRRLFRRYVIDGLPFAAWLLAVSAVEGFTGGKNAKA